ncbi:MAG: hypothetical protein K2P58_12670 [Hyphomonadaceae bacterium]|nr:hypothetical protein [Hyphomonadaceae bacterium]
MRDARPFAAAGLVVAALAVTLGLWLGGGLSDQRAALFTAIVLVIGEPLAALWAAGPEERKRRPLAWVRTGLVAATLSFIGLWVLVVPSAFIAIMGGAGADPLWTYIAIAFALFAAVVIVWYTHRFAWRRAAPPPDSA